MLRREGTQGDPADPRPRAAPSCGEDRPDAEGSAPSREPFRRDADRPLRWEGNKSEGMNVNMAGTPRMPSTPYEERGKTLKRSRPAQGRTRQQAPLLVHGVRTCPRCLVGPGREKGGKHYGHDREADNCALQGTSLRGGAARKQLQQKAAESSTRTDQTILTRFRTRSTTTKATAVKTKARKPRMESSPSNTRTRGTRTPLRALKTSRPATRTTRPTARDTPTTTRRTRTTTRPTRTSGTNPRELRKPADQQQEQPGRLPGTLLPQPGGLTLLPVPLPGPLRSGNP